MAHKANSWNDFIQSREARIVMYAFVALICAGYAVDAVREMLTPERAAQLMVYVGAPVYYAMTVTRAVACAWGTVAFSRMAYKLYQEKDGADNNKNAPSSAKKNASSDGSSSPGDDPR